jgi:hypothetical protein
MVAIDTGHRDNGWSLLEFPPFNLFNQWMKNVGEWIRWFDSTTATFFGGTDTGTVDAFVLTGIVSFPANASIISGTLLSFVASTGITGDSTVSVNGQAPIQILNLDGFILQYGMIPAGMRLFLEYNGTKWILLNPRKQRRQWSLMADGSAAAGSLTSAGFTQGSFSLSGTGGSLVSDHTLISTPSVTFSATATSGHEALFTTTNLCLLVYSVMNLFIHSTSVEADGAGQGFIGYASGDPDLTGTDPLANLTGWGIWFKWTGTTVSAVSFVNNNGNATSAITAVLTGVSKFSELFTNISLNGGVFTCEVIKSGVATVVTSNTKVPATTVTSSYVIKPYIYLHNGSSNTLNMEVAEVYGDYGN